MFLESIIALTCVVGKAGCSEATSAYYQYNKDLQQSVKNIEAYGEKLIEGHEYVVYVLTPAYAVATGQTANFKLHRTLVLSVDVKGSVVGIQWSY